MGFGALFCHFGKESETQIPFSIVIIHYHRHFMLYTQSIPTADVHFFFPHLPANMTNYMFSFPHRDYYLFLYLSSPEVIARVLAGAESKPYPVSCLAGSMKILLGQSQRTETAHLQHILLAK